MFSDGFLELFRFLEYSIEYTCEEGGDSTSAKNRPWAVDRNNEKDIVIDCHILKIHLVWFVPINKIGNTHGLIHVTSMSFLSSG